MIDVISGRSKMGSEILDSYEPEAAFRTIIAERIAQIEDVWRSGPWSVTEPVSQLLQYLYFRAFSDLLFGFFLSFYPKSIRLVLFFFRNEGVWDWSWVFIIYYFGHGTEINLSQ